MILSQTMIYPFPQRAQIAICETCQRQYAIFDRDSDWGEWNNLAIVDFCPRCGAGQKTDYAGVPIKDTK